MRKSGRWFSPVKDIAPCLYGSCFRRRSVAKTPRVLHEAAE